MTFADGSHVDLSNTRILRFFNATNAFVGEVSIPTTQLNGYGYVHLGLVKPATRPTHGIDQRYAPFAISKYAGLCHEWRRRQLGHHAGG